MHMTDVDVTQLVLIDGYDGIDMCCECGGGSSAFFDRRPVSFISEEVHFANNECPCDGVAN